MYMCIYYTTLAGTGECHIVGRARMSLWRSEQVAIPPRGGSRAGTRWFVDAELVFKLEVPEISIDNLWLMFIRNPSKLRYIWITRNQ